MKWENRGRSRNVTDNRGRGGGGYGRSVGGGMASLGVGGFLVLLVLSLVFGVDLFGLLGIQSPLGGSLSTSPGLTVPGQGANDEERVAFVWAGLDDSQASWASMC